MGDYHTVYKGAEGDPLYDTEWNALQRKFGNLPPKEPAWKPDPFVPKEESKHDREWLEAQGEHELEGAEDEFDDDRALEQIRQARLKELQEAARRPRFGSVESIRGSEFVEKVTNASQDAWVVVLLYKEGSPDCVLLQSCLEELAQKYPTTSFVRMISTDCIANYPDRNLPTLLIYKGGGCKHNLVGLQPFGGQHVTPEAVALVLNKCGDVCGGEEEEAVHLKNLINRVIEKREAADEVEDEDSDFD